MAVRDHNTRQGGTKRADRRAVMMSTAWTWKSRYHQERRLHAFAGIMSSVNAKTPRNARCRF